MSAVTTEAREVLGRLRMLLQGDGAIGKRERAALAEFIAAALEWEEGDEPDFAAFALSAAGGHLGAAVEELMAEKADLVVALKDARNYIECTVLNTHGKTARNYGGCLSRIDAALASAEPAPNPADTDRAVNARRELREVTR